MAQADQVDFDLWTPAFDTNGFLGIQGTRTPGPGMMTFGVAAMYMYRPVVLELAGGDERVLLEHAFNNHLTGQVGVGGRLALALDWPVYINPQSASASAEAASAAPAVPDVAPADPRLYARYRVMGPDSKAVLSRAEGPGLAVQLGARLPMGVDNGFVSESAVRLEGQVLGDFHLLGAGAGLMLGYRHRFETVQWEGTTFRDVLLGGLAIEAPLPVKVELAAIMELRVQTDAGAPFRSSLTTPVDADLGVRWFLNEVALTAGVGTGFTDAYGSASLRGFFTLIWSPHEADADADGVRDDRDQCPYLPEDRDGFQDRDGCPDPDDDMDFVPDVDDRCPREAPPEGADRDQDGCIDR
jgi:OOP family OmpA-OmpF porin